MKKVIFVIVIFLLVGCSKKITEMKDLDFLEKQNYIKENKDDLSKVIVRRVTNGSDNCYLIDTETGYELFTSIDEIKKSGKSMTDNYITYKFLFNDDTNISFSFVGPYYEENRNTYELVEFSHAKFREDDKIECE